MSYTEEVISGGVGVVIGTYTNQPDVDWVLYMHEAFNFFWPVIYGGLMAFGTHLAKRIIMKYQTKNKNREK